MSLKKLPLSIVHQIQKLPLQQQEELFLHVARTLNTQDPTWTSRMFTQMDKDKNGNLSIHEWTRALQKDKWHRVFPKEQTSSTSTSASTSTSFVPKPELRQLLLCTALPYMGFGFVDNFIMITAGDLIDAQLGSVLHLSTLAAAALGNTVSDIAGLGIGGIIQSTSSKLGVPPPTLTASQQKLLSVRACHLIGSISGLTIGCTLGMFPLLFF